MLANGDIKKRALDLGFSDVRLACADEEIRTPSGGLVSPRLLVGGASCIIVLFMAYLPSREASRGNIALSPYYIASNRAYEAAKQLTEYIKQSGADALHTASISARAAAIRTGGFTGDNGFYYHEAFGSYVCIQTVISTAGEPEVYERARSECLHCGSCAKSCAAVKDLRGCIRAHMHGIVPEALRVGIYQLLGCEMCQSACPLNSGQTSRPLEFSVKELLCGQGMDRLKQLAGPNMARLRRIQSQAALYAGGAGLYELADDLKRLSEEADEPVKTHALWAYNKLTGESDDNT